jgi:hypothetical protein
MQMIEFLGNFFTKGLEIHSSFYCIFPDSFNFLKFKISKFKTSYKKLFEILIFQNSNLKNTKFQIKKMLNFEPVSKGLSHNR